jgi:hypothetical protein
MKTSLTRKEILTIANKSGMFFNPNMTKKGMMEFVEMGLRGNNERAVTFAQTVISADKQYQRELKLKSLGIN